MIQGSAFQTRARTVDHLGREQIADCPTAISELWKNAFDAYAQSVELNIFDGSVPVAAIIDDGHGMSSYDFAQRWLVVGTETKATTDRTPVKDRNGLKIRPRQGQKGIGRLSCGNLGPLLLLVSKRIQTPFVAALVDWRLFENPFINLSDIFVPVTEFQEFDQIFELLPDLAASLSQNVTGGDDSERSQRIRDAWSASDKLLTGNRDDDGDGDPGTLSRDILSTISRMPFESRHFRQWSVAAGDCGHGTAMLVSEINYDLRIQLDETVSDVTASAAKDRFFETLSSFVDPFIDPIDQTAERLDLHFSYVARSWRDGAHRVIVGSEKQFDKRQVDRLEHRIEGSIDADGIFSGRVRAFGEWLPDDCVIEPPDDLTIPRRRDTKLGPLELYIASMEFKQVNTTHSPSEFQFYQDLAERYAGFMVFRDGLRVLPYGRTDNDFFNIESRRSKSAGREFWNHRQMFGRLAVTRDQNPNLKDKAGREGLLDNRAAKTLKAIVSNLLMQSARRYFGSASDIRKELLPQISAENERRRASEARNRLRQRQRKEFRKKLRKYLRELPIFVREVERYADTLDIDTVAQVPKAQRTLEKFHDRLSDFRLPAMPTNLGLLENSYSEYRATIKSIHKALAELTEHVEHSTKELSPAKPRVLLEKQLASQSDLINRRVLTWSRTINALQKNEYQRIREIVKQRNSLFDAEAKPLIHRFETGQISYSETSKSINALKERIDEQNRELFVSYIGALESMQESIDLEHLATFGMEEIGQLRTELERLNSLAQLGIAVEIVGHELQSYDDIIASAIKRLPLHIRESESIKDIEFGYEGLTDQLRFLSPLRLAGQKIQRWIKGSEIFSYVSEFFKLALVKNRISFTATDSFQAFSVFDQRSRLYPVFINLLNNSIYWLSVSDNKEKKIVFDIIGHDVVVSDNGPGIASEDLENLFSLFFTRKIHGGRGVGLYLCRANLTAGGHTIRYEPSTVGKPLPGANFLISFRGAEFDGG